MIPKTIHYCWFGRNEKPQLAKKCIKSWEKYCPNFEVIEWNEDNFDVNMNAYTKWCYQEKKYAFLSDYVRLYVVHQFGGIYFDTDVELMKPIDDLLLKKAFFGFETQDYINSGLGFGSEANGAAVGAMLHEYEPLLDGKHGTIGCPKLNSAAMIKLGLIPNGELQTVADAVIYPIEYFNPFDAPTVTLNKTKNTVSVHWYAGSWLPVSKRIRSKLTRPIHKIFGKDSLKWLKRKKS